MKLRRRIVLLAIVLIASLLCYGLLSRMHRTDGIRTIAIPPEEYGYSNFSLTVIGSHEELDDFLRRIKAQDAWNHRRDDFIKELRHAELDFEKEVLILIPHIAGSGSIKVWLDPPYRQSRTVICNIRRQVPQWLAADQKSYCFALAVERDKVDQIEVWEDRDYYRSLPYGEFLPFELKRYYELSLVEVLSVSQ